MWKTKLQKIVGNLPDKQFGKLYINGYKKLATEKGN